MVAFSGIVMSERGLLILMKPTSPAKLASIKMYVGYIRGYSSAIKLSPYQMDVHHQPCTLRVILKSAFACSSPHYSHTHRRSGYMVQHCHWSRSFAPRFNFAIRGLRAPCPVKKHAARCNKMPDLPTWEYDVVTSTIPTCLAGGRSLIILLERASYIAIARLNPNTMLIASRLSARVSADKDVRQTQFSGCRVTLEKPPRSRCEAGP
jgi:hypothetical protein